ncbi:MAG: TIGR02757 family protein [Flavobacteriales bacterium]|mgnify:CR=1 FL=1|jgi:uncharacterized protein (TIGR02757 family)|tara:strand:+ start:52 stop:810 length:759 start_codon:yes stop_codon:yes gene_type:complete
MTHKDLKDFLDDKVALYQKPNFINDDPISIPHEFSLKEDIEISAFLSATIAWGRRAMIMKNARGMMTILDNSPYDFILNASEKEINKSLNFCHRTFQGVDLQTFIYALRNIYQNHNGLEACFYTEKDDMSEGISNFKQTFFSIEHLQRTQKHISDPLKGSASKRLIMFLRWMVRPNNKGVDFGVWKTLNPSQLSCPLDVHTANVARKLGLINRKANDWKTVKELDVHLRSFCKEDPAKYDFALFGLGIYEKF